MAWGRRAARSGPDGCSRSTAGLGANPRRTAPPTPRRAGATRWSTPSSFLGAGARRDPVALQERVVGPRRAGAVTDDHGLGEHALEPPALLEARAVLQLHVQVRLARVAAAAA